MPASRLDDYIAECRALRDEYRGRLDILCGIEQDYFGGRADSIHDYVIGSVHYLPAGDVPLAIDEGADELASLTERYYGGDILSAAECYFSLVAEVGTVTGAGIVGHFDLITKYIERGIALDTSSPRYRSAWQRAADRLLSEGLIFEINTGAVSRGYRSSPYPSDEMVDYIVAHGGRFISRATATARIRSATALKNAGMLSARDTGNGAASCCLSRRSVEELLTQR